MRFRRSRDSRAQRVRTGRTQASRKPSLEVLEGRALLATFVVNNAADSGDGSLRQAIIADGCIVSDAHIERSVVGVRTTHSVGGGPGVQRQAYARAGSGGGALR